MLKPYFVWEIRTTCQLKKAAVPEEEAVVFPHGSAVHPARGDKTSAFIFIRINDMSIPLRSLPVGRKARIASVRADGELGRRIRDMGLVTGAEVEVIGRAPLRDPVALRLPGFTLSLRNNEADYILVEPVD